MKRYFLFMGRNYYPNAGMEDFKGDFNSENEAKMEIENVYKKEFDEYKCVFSDYEDFLNTDVKNNRWEIIYDAHERKNIFERT